MLSASWRFYCSDPNCLAKKTSALPNISVKLWLNLCLMPYQEQNNTNKVSKYPDNCNRKIEEVSV